MLFCRDVASCFLLRKEDVPVSEWLPLDLERLFEAGYTTTPCLPNLRRSQNHQAQKRPAATTMKANTLIPATPAVERSLPLVGASVGELYPEVSEPESPGWFSTPDG
jgi:hypothetical protein